MIIHELDIDMVPGGHAPLLALNNGDTDFGLVLNLYNSHGEFQIQSGTTAKLIGKKPDGSGYEKSASISGMSIIVANSSQLTDVSGYGELEVCLTHNGKSLHSQNFPFYVEQEANGGTET